jgi:hypothetical protein
MNVLKLHLFYNVEILSDATFKDIRQEDCAQEGVEIPWRAIFLFGLETLLQEFLRPTRLLFPPSPKCEDCIGYYDYQASFNSILSSMLAWDNTVLLEGSCHLHPLAPTWSTLHLVHGIWNDTNHVEASRGECAILKMLRRKSKTQFVKQKRNTQNTIAILNYLKRIAPQQLMVSRQVFTKNCQSKTF